MIGCISHNVGLTKRSKACEVRRCCPCLLHLHQIVPLCLCCCQPVPANSACVFCAICVFALCVAIPFCCFLFRCCYCLVVIVFLHKLSELPVVSTGKHQGGYPSGGVPSYHSDKTHLTYQKEVEHDMFLCLFFCLSVFLYLSVSVCLSVFIPRSLSVSLSVSLFLYLSVSLSLSLSLSLKT